MREEFPVVFWGERRITFRWSVTQEEAASAGAVLVFAFQRSKIVLADIRDRGWCVPSGRIEPGESHEAAARREAAEEAGILLGTLVPFGATVTLRDHEIHHVAAVAFLAHVDRILPFEPSEESRGVRLADPDELPQIYYLWDPLIEAVFHAAWNRIGAVPMS